MANPLKRTRTPTTYAHALRSAVGAAAALGAARLCGVADPHWAAISALVVLQSSLETSLFLSVQRLLGTAVGAAAGAAIGGFLPGSLPAFGAGVLAIGLACAATRADQAALRYSGITLAVVMLIPHGGSLWMTALWRFLAVSVGIAVALGVAVAWPGRRMAA
ncbi:MAG TPA: FUSC family protein [Opitutaceae bacterium]|jgi:uncharacterized membrane protein YccC